MPPSPQHPPATPTLGPPFTLDFFENGLSGKLPAELEKLTSLKFPDLNNNFFSGEIFNNSISGSIPPEIDIEELGLEEKTEMVVKMGRKG
ncbi:Probable leucine-rich repeat receptor-like protein kinase At5g63930 [Linum perenne]